MEASTKPRAGAPVPGSAGKLEPLTPEGEEQIEDNEHGVSPGEVAEAQAKDGIPDAGDVTETQANEALTRMLASNAPALPTETINMQALADRQGWEKFEVTVRALGDEEFTAVGERAERSPNKRERANGQTMPVVDQSRLKRLLVCAAMMEPDLQNSELLAKFGPAPEHVVRRWFLPGEIDQLSDIITDISGWSRGALARAKK